MPKRKTNKMPVPPVIEDFDDDDELDADEGFDGVYLHGEALTDDHMVELQGAIEQNPHTPARVRIKQFCDDLRKEYKDMFPQIVALPDLLMLGAMVAIVFSRARTLPPMLYPPQTYNALTSAGLHLHGASVRAVLVEAMATDSKQNNKDDMIEYYKQAAELIDQTVAQSIDIFEPYMHAIDCKQAVESGFGMQ